MNTEGYLKRKAVFLTAKAFMSIISKIGFPIICFLLIFFILITGLADSENENVEIKDEKGNTLKGKATYVGVDDRDTDFSRKVLAQTSVFSNARNPYYNGYRNLCEGFCSAMYAKAGLPYRGSCCAYRHSVRTANRFGKIPKGEMSFWGPHHRGKWNCCR